MNIDFRRLAFRLLPPSKRLDWIVVWLEVLLWPLQSLNNLFVNYANDLTYFESFTGQVIYLEHILNDLFDPTNRGIYIEDNIPVQPLYLYNHAENQEDTFVYNKSEGAAPLYLYNQAQIDADFDFIVIVPPNVIVTDEDYMRAIINRYKLASKRYKIEYA